MPRLALIAIALAALGILTAVCLHSLQEIHYLKGFIPPVLTVEQACYAGVLELVKVTVISLPLVLVIAVCLFFCRRRQDR